MTSVICFLYHLACCKLQTASRLRAFQHVGSKHAHDDTLVHSPCALQALEKLLGFASQPDLDSAARHLTAAAAELQRLRASASLAQHDAVVAACFDASVNRRKMAPTPPRSMPVGSPASLPRHHVGVSTVAVGAWLLMAGETTLLHSLPEKLSHAHKCCINRLTCPLHRLATSECADVAPAMPIHLLRCCLPAVGNVQADDAAQART
jgi:hypothetical protein